MDSPDGYDGPSEEDFGGWFGGITQGIGNLINVIRSILDPSSDTFFLRIAFIPSEGYFQGKIEEIKENVESRFTILSQFVDTINSVINASYADVNEWQGIKGDFSRYGVAGETVIVDPTFINYISQKIKFWISGLIWFVTALYTVKKISTLLGVAK